MMSENPEKQKCNEQKAIGDVRLLKIQSNTVLLSIIHRSIGALTFTNHRGGTGYGTATLISKDIILTAAHNVYSRDGKKSAEHSNFKFYLGASGEVRSYYTIKQWKYLQEYKKCSSNEKVSLDYAIMQLETNIKMPVHYKNFCELSVTCKQCKIQNIDKQELQIYGYPLIKQNYVLVDKHEKIRIHQYGLTKYENALEGVDYKEGLMYYNVSTLPGQSGCGVISKGNIMAIHVGSHPDEELNIGRLITADLVQNLYNWCKQLNGNALTINVNSLCQHNRKRPILKEIINEVNQNKDQKQIKLDRFTHSSQIAPQAQIDFDASSQQQQELNLFQPTIGGQEIDRRQIMVASSALFRKACKQYEANNLEAALQIFRQCLAFQGRLGNNYIQKSFTLLQIGSIYTQLKQSSRAIASYKKAIEIRQANKQRDSTYIILLKRLASVYRSKENYTKAIKYYQQGLNLTKQKQQRGQFEKSIQQCNNLIEKSLKQLKRLRRSLKQLQNS